VDILDVVQAVNCILLGTDDCYCGDLNGDDIINVQDIILIVTIIMGIG